VPGVSQEWKDKWQDIREVTGAKEAVEKYEKQIIEQVQKAMMTAKAHGHGPAGMEAFDDVCEPSKEPWYNHLHRYMQSLSVSEYNWAKMNRRTLVQHHIFAPSHYSESLGEIAFGIDCSGSVFDAASQANFAGHVNAILAEAKPSKVHIFYFDSDVTRHDELDYGCLDFSTRPAGGGGTDFCPVFEQIEELGLALELLVMLTDCYGDFPKEVPSYPVIWASIEEDPRGYFPPFGEFIHVE
jgi:predicted metal-dependent peptidase